MQNNIQSVHANQVINQEGTIPDSATSFAYRHFAALTSIVKTDRNKGGLDFDDLQELKIGTPYNNKSFVWGHSLSMYQKRRSNL